MRSFNILLAGLVVVISVLAMCHAETLKERREKSVLTCAKELKLTDAEVEILSSDSWFEKTNKDASGSMKCAILCVGQQMGLIDANKQYNQQLIAENVADYYNVPIEKTLESVKKCLAIAGLDDCEKAYMLASCIQDSM